MLDKKNVTVYSKQIKIGETGRLDIQTNDVNNNVSFYFVNNDKIEYNFIINREDFNSMIENMKLFDELFKTDKSI